MKNLTLLSTILVAGSALFAGVAAAGNERNPDNARAMAEALKGGGGGNNSPLKESFGLTGNGGVASYVSGSKSLFDNKNGGWGNFGSTLVPGGGQVSNPKQ